MILQTTVRNVRHALRSLRRTPTFTVVVVVSVALAIGGSTVAFVLVYEALLRPLPVKEPDRVAILMETSSVTCPNCIEGVSYATFSAWRAGHPRSMEGLTLYRSTTLVLEGGEEITGAAVGPSFFTLLGTSATRGRMLGPPDVGGGSSVLLSHTLWPKGFVRLFMETERLSRIRLSRDLFIGLSALALLAAIIGIHGVVAEAVGRRTKEMGLRMALGASASSVVATACSRALAYACRGVLCGGAVAYGLVQVMGKTLYGRHPELMQLGVLIDVKAFDPVVVGTIAILMLIVVVLAAYRPALHATRIDPTQALRYE